MEMEKKTFGKQMVARFQHRDTERTWIKQTLLGSSCLPHLTHIKLQLPMMIASFLDRSSIKILLGSEGEVQMFFLSLSFLKSNQLKIINIQKTNKKTTKKQNKKGIFWGGSFSPEQTSSCHSLHLIPSLPQLDGSEAVTQHLSQCHPIVWGRNHSIL